MSLVTEIQTTFPNYRDLATAAFQHQHNLWEKPMYQDNPVFQTLKLKYGTGNDAVTTRQQIIDLFNAGNFYDGYLCALVWGKIGTFQNGRQHFNAAFSVPKKDVETKIKNIKNLISQNKLGDAFDSMCRGGVNNFPGVGVSFFTKLLYFVGATVKCNVKPLILDSTSLRILNRIRADKGIIMRARQTRKDYLEFCDEMNTLSQQLLLPSAGHLEALLFNEGKVLI